MIYKFKSQSAGDVIMLEANGEQMVTLIGKAPSPQGIITVAQILAAIAALEAAVVMHEAAEHRPENHAHKELVAGGDGVRLRARTAPFIGLLKISLQAGDDVVWGV